MVALNLPPACLAFEAFLGISLGQTLDSFPTSHHSMSRLLLHAGLTIELGWESGARSDHGSAPMDWSTSTKTF